MRKTTNSLTCPEESDYAGRTVERNEHHRYAAILSQMADSFIPCRQIKVLVSKTVPAIGQYR